MLLGWTTFLRAESDSTFKVPEPFSGTVLSLFPGRKIEPASGIANGEEVEVRTSGVAPFREAAYPADHVLCCH